MKLLNLFFIKDSELDYNEDKVWCKRINKFGKIPPVNEAMKFSFENFPEYLYELNNKELPFGCHNWYNYYNYNFYKDFIPLE